MGLVDWVLGVPAYFRRKPGITSRDDLIEFLDTRAAFLIQKNIFDYARARAGPYFKVMINEPEFKQAVELSRWTSYPVGLAAIAEIARGVLFESGERKALGNAIASATLAAFDKYPVPAALREEAWKQARETLIERLAQIDLHPPKFAKDVITPYGQLIFDAQPIHEEMRKADYEMIQSQMRVNLITMHDEFETRTDKRALLADLGVPPRGACG
jgi:hypothetical protein